MNENGNLNSILTIVEDNAADATHYLRLLEEVSHGFGEVQCINTLDRAFEVLSSQPPACCLLDYRFPDGTALGLLDQLNKKNGQGVCPFVVITGQEDTKTAVELMHKGAQDYLIKQDVTAAELIRAINNAMKTWGLQKQLNYLALHDPLTGSVNRSLFIDRLAQLFSEASRYRRNFALIYVDLDRFKAINDTYGHEAGDYLLTSIAQRMRNVLRNTDTVARLGGDEFAILLPNISESKANYVANKLVNALTCDLKWQNTSLAVSPSIGLTCFPGKAANYQELMREADLALYRAKQNGRGQYSTFNKHLEEESHRSIILTTALPRALLNKELQVAYQPIVSLSSGEVKSVEALVRWSFKDEWVSPSKIIDMVLERRLGDFFHEWLFEECIGQLKVWQNTHPNLQMSINMPAGLCHDARISKRLLSTIESHGIEPEKIIVEITETHLMLYADITKMQLDELAQNRITIAIDDFGTGYSSLQYLASLPCEILKIDQHFFLNLHKSKKNYQIIEAITALGHRLGMSVVAEGIESEPLYELAKKFGCDSVQGFWIGKPEFGDKQFNSYIDLSCHDKETPSNFS